MGKIFNAHDFAKKSVDIMSEVARLDDKKHREKICKAMRRDFLDIMRGEHILCPEFLDITTPQQEEQQK